MSGSSRHALSAIHRAALSCLVLAAATGLVWRTQAAFGLTQFDFRNLRHAHSHLMFFGWVTPAAMALLVASVLQQNPGARLPKRTLWAALGLGLCSHPLFLAFGYGRAQIGGLALPLAAMVAGASTWVWYAFAHWYARENRGRARTEEDRLGDYALLLLVLSTAGAWGLSLLVPLGVRDPFWTEALKAQFVSTFSEGWLVAVALFVQHKAAPGDAHPRLRVANWMLLGTAPFAFLSTLDQATLPRWLTLWASLASVGLGLALLLHVAVLLQRGAQLPPLVFLGLAALARIMVGVTPHASWHALHGLRVVVLHAVLLGFVTLTLARAGQPNRRALWTRAETAVATLLLLSVVPLSELWPPQLAGVWSLHLAVLAALFATLVFGASLLRSGRAAH
jgi:hypothetical protein